MPAAALLIPITLKVTVVLIAAWLVTRAMVRCSAATRHLVWTLALAGVLALPAVQVVGPRWDLPVLPAVPLGSDPIDGATQPLDTGREWGLTPPDVDPIAAPDAAPILTADTERSAPPATGIGWPTLLVAIWVAGTMVALLRLFAGLVWATWIVRQARRATDPLWLAVLDEAAAALHVKARVSLRCSARTTIPVACGIWRSTVLLPMDADGWPEDRRRVVLLHEMAHVARHDCLVQSIAQLARAVHWFNPLAHLAIARLRTEQERACDDLVLAAGTDAPAYADHLVEIARRFRAVRFPAWATLAMARPSQLEGRVVDILDDRRNRQPPAGWVRAAVGAAALALLLPIGAVGLTAAAGPAEPQATPAPPAGEAHAPGAALEAAQAVPAPLMAPGPQQTDGVELPAGPPDTPDVVVSAAGQIIDTLRGLDFDVDLDFDFDSDWDPSPAPEPDPNPVPRSADRAQTQAQTQSQDTVVSDETRRRVADALITALNDENEDVREQALAALAGMRDPRAIPGLVRALRDASANVRERAVDGLSQFSTAEAVDAIVTALKDQNADVRERAARHLTALIGRGLLSDPKYVDVLAGLVRDAEPDVRVHAIMALGRLRRQESVATLLPLLKDANKDVREQTAVSLGFIADPRAIDALTAALKDMEPDVREQAARALGQIARGQRRGSPPSPKPPKPPAPPAAGTKGPWPPQPPHVTIDTEAIREAAARAQEAAQRWLEDFQVQQEQLRQERQENQRQQDGRR